MSLRTSIKGWLGEALQRSPEAYWLSTVALPKIQLNLNFKENYQVVIVLRQIYFDLASVM